MCEKSRTKVQYSPIWLKQNQTIYQAVVEKISERFAESDSGAEDVIYDSSSDSETEGEDLPNFNVMQSC